MVIDVSNLAIRDYRQFLKQGFELKVVNGRAVMVRKNTSAYIQSLQRCGRRTMTK